MTVGDIYSLRLPLFLLSLVAVAAAIAIPASSARPLYEPSPEELDENADEDDEDDAEYEEIKAEFEKNGATLEEYGE